MCGCLRPCAQLWARVTTGSLKPLTWISPWRWYVADAMLIKGLTWNVALPFVAATFSLLVGWWAFLRRDLRSP